MRQRRVVSIIMALALIISATGCGSPQDKKMKFYNKGKALYEKGDYTKASLELKNAIQIDPKFADAYYLLGMSSLKQKNPRQAYGAFSKAISLNPDHTAANLELGRMFLAANAPGKALEKATLVLKKEPGNTDALLIKSGYLLLTNHAAEAQPILLGLLQKGVRKPELYTMLSGTYIRNKEMDKARQTLEEGTRSNPGSGELYFALATLSARTGDLKGTEDALKKIVELKPVVANKLNLATLYLETNRKNEADKLIAGILAGKATSEDDILAVSKFYLQHNLASSAEKILRDEVQKNAKTVKLRLALAELSLGQGKTDDAMTLLNQALKLEKKPNTPLAVQAKNTLAACYVKKGELDKALSMVDEALQDNPKGTDLHYTKGRILLLKGQGTKAVPELRMVVNDRPDFIPAHIALSEAHRMNGEPAMALDALRGPLKANPNSPELLLAIAQYYARDKKYADALTTLKNLLAINPKYGQAHAFMAEIYLAKGDVAKAEQEYQTLIGQNPKSPLGYMRLAQIQASRNQMAKATTMAEEGLRRNPASPQLFNLVIELSMRQNNPAKAIQLCTQRLAANPQDELSHFLLGKIYLSTGKPAESEQELEKAIAIAPLWPEPSYLLSRLYLVQGKRDQAIQRFNALLKQNPKNPTPYLILGQIYEQTGDHANARRIYEQAISVYPDLWPALNNLAFMLADNPTSSNDVKRAQELASRVKGLRPDDPTVLDTVGWVNLKAGNVAQARELFATAQEKDPHNPVYSYHMAEALLKAGDRAGAIERLQAALKTKDAFYGRDQAEKRLKELTGKN